MAEIGSLEVSLSLNANNFNGTISQVNQNMKAMGGELQALKAKGSDYEQSVEGLSKKQDILQRSLEASSIKLQETRKRYDELVASGKATDAQLARAATAVNKAQAEYNKLDKQLNQVTDELEKQTNKWVQAQKKISEFGAKLGDVGGKFKNIGGTLTASVTTPIAALGTGALVTASKFETSQAKIQASLGVTAQEAEKLQATAQRVWKDGFGDSLEDVTRSLIQVKQNMKLVADGAELEKVTRDALLLAQTFEADVNEVTRAGNNLMVNFGISAEEAFDMMTKGAQEGLNFSNEMFDNLAEYTPLWGQMGYSAEQMFGILQRGAEKGVYNLDFLNDLMKEFQIKVKDGSKTTQDSMDQLSESTQAVWNDFLVGNTTVAEVATTIVDELKGMEDQVLANQIAVGLFGTKWEDLESDAVYAMLSSTDALEGFKGSMDKLAEAHEKTFGQRWDETLRTAEEALLPLGETLLDIADDVLPKINSGIEDLTGWFNELSPAAQDATLAIGGTAAVAGPLLVGIGLAAEGISGLIKLGSPLIKFLKNLGPTGAGGAAASGIGSIGSVLGPATVGLGLFTGGADLLSRKWDDLLEKQPSFLLSLGSMAPQLVGTAFLMDQLRDRTGATLEVTDLFGEGVSEATKKAVGGYFELSEQADLALKELVWSQEEVTQKMAEDMSKKQQEMTTTLITAINDRQEQEKELARQHIRNLEGLSDEQKNSVIERINERYAEERTKTEEGNAQIQEIYQRAANNNRRINEEESAQILAIRESMKEQSVEVMSDSELEQKIILERMKENASTISATEAAEVVKNSLQKKNESIKNADEQYKDTYKWAVRQRDELGTLSAEEAQLIIDEAEKKREETKKSAEEMHRNVVSEAQKQADEHVNLVNWETGEVLSKWDAYKIALGKKGSEIVEDLKAYWKDYWNSTVDIWNKITTWPGKKIDEMKTAIATKMAEVEANIEAGWNKAQTFLSSIDLKQIGRDIIGGLITGITEKIPSVNTLIENLSSNIPAWAKKILKINSPAKTMIPIGEGVVEGINVGIQNKKSSTQKVVEELSKVIKDTTKKNETEVAKIADEAEKKRTEVQEEYATKRAKLKAKETEKLVQLNNDEQKKLKSINDKAWSDMMKKQEQVDSEKLSAIKTFLDEKRGLEQLSLVDEALIWEESLKHFKDGTEAKIKAQLEYRDALNAVNNEIVSINEEYSSKILEVNEELKTREQELTETYTKAVDDRAKSLISFSGLFEEFDIKFATSGTKLIRNLESQVEGFKTWQKEIEELSTRAIDEGLLEELRQMGPEALAEVMALNKLTDDQLTHYSDLYKEKSQLAREQAVAELEPMKQDIDTKLIELRTQSSIRLTELQTEWKSKIQGITAETEAGFSSMRDIGVNAMQGLSDGLESMEPSLMRQARRIADKIRDEIEDALDINSPSRVMKGIGVFIGQGLIEGMDAMVSQVSSASAKLADSTMSGFIGSSSSTTSIDRSKHISAPITIQASDNVARDVDRAMRQVLFGI